MAATTSTMLPLGTHAPDFALPDLAPCGCAGPCGGPGRIIRRDDFRSAPALLVMFICNHCPFVKHLRAPLAALCREYQARGVAIVAINSNDVQAYPDDAPDKMAEEARSAGYTFPYLFDESQMVAKAFHAACTPDFFVFDRARRLVYRGQFDDSRPSTRSFSGNSMQPDGRDLRAALDAVLAGRAPSPDQKPSIGCNIKWKAGNEPRS